MNNFHDEKMIKGSVVIGADVKTVWEAWTTEEGIKSFFAPACKVDFRVDGMYEIYFNLNEEPGKRGSEGMRILAIQPYHMFSFTWNAPPELPKVREQRTHVTLRFETLGQNRTRVILINDGYGEGEEWDKAFKYFMIAWTKIVLHRLQYRFNVGPVDWSNPPTLN